MEVLSMKLTEAIRKQADVTTTMTVEEAKRLPNMLGAIASRMLSAQGWYGYNQGGKKHLIVRA